MLEKKILNKLVVIKSTQLNENQGFVTPILSISENEEFTPILRHDYPQDILVSRGYPYIDSNYDTSELFILKTHNLDEEKTQQSGSPRYWARDESAFSDLTPSTLLPIVPVQLPSKENGILPAGMIPPTRPFFILDDGYLFGPLTSSQTDEDRYIVEPYVHPSLSFGKGYIGRFPLTAVNDCVIETRINGESMLFVSSFKQLSSHRNDKSSIDYVSDDQLIKVVNLLGFGKQTKGLGKKEAERLQQIIADSEKANKFGKQDERLERLKGLLDRYLSEADIGFELIKNYLESNSGQEFLNNYVEANKSTLLSDFIDKVRADAKAEEKKIQQKLQEQQAQITAKEQEISQIINSVAKKRKDAQDEIARIAAETEGEVRQTLQLKQQELSEHIVSLEKEQTALEKKIKDKIDRLGLVDEIEELKKTCNYYEQHSKRLESTVKGFEATLKNNDTEELAKKIGEMEAINRVLNGKSASVSKPAQQYSPVIYSDSEPDTAEQLIDAISAHFAQDNGRMFSKEEMTNLIVSVNQSFLTILSGPPGTGKTSTVTRLAKALHLGNSKGDQNFLYVPVGRGWVSSRDTLGFYNSLKDVYQESRTGLYSFLARQEPKDSDALKLILLDEANLSSMEHYWSDFLALCDLENLNRPIDTGIPHEGHRFLKIGDNTRFIATINNDATTEKLSPRLIDRVPVITLDSPTDKIVDTASLTLNGSVKASKLRALFVPEYAELSKADEFILSKIIDTLSTRDSALGKSIPISRRKVNAITNYCDVAGQMIGSEAAMDFAIQQHILPHIEGYGAAFRKRLEQLLAIVNKTYPRSAGQIERILASGNEFTGSYSYF
ncbi:AAA family ATPase [Vibrio cholerae]|uniref:AAA family ATPase n=1 Tax=Vibrio cholerae TaxID=666 RepID=UPI002A318012|nr:AAA family ATPase [Vibrio cholerae]EKF9206272.1 AAA family ATPase [Vibrio cholerae]EMC4025509.1 AAA family ATPase [Vibrio cholerae]